MSKPEDGERAVAETVDSFGKIDILVTCAGSSPGGLLEDLTEDEWFSSLNLKFMGYVRACRAVLPRMREQGSGSVVLVVGNDGLKPTPWETTAGVANAADINFASAMVEQYGKAGVRINTVNPGPVNTDRWEGLEEAFARDKGVSRERAHDLAVGSIPFGRICEPEEVADLVAFGQLVALALGGDDGTIKLWNWRKSELLHTLEHSKAIKAIAFSRDGQTLVSESLDETVKIWNPQTGTLISTPIENSDLTFINAVALHPSGQVLASASGGENSQLRLWNLQTGSKLNTLKGFSSPIFSIAFSPNGQTLISGNQDGTITIWQSR